MSIKLRELIRNVRACKTAAEERATIAKECALIRTSFKEKQDTGFRHRNVAKLLYIHMLGYPTHFGQMESLKLIASNRFPEKRIGYLGLMLLLDEKQEVLMLVTNSLKNDLVNKTNTYVNGLALCSLGNVCSADMARDLSPEIEKLLQKSNPYIRKKAALCAIRICRKVPDLIEDYVQHAIELLKDKNHAVLLTAVCLMTEIITLDPSTVDVFRKEVQTVVRLLKEMVLAGYVSEYDVCGITDPFLQCRIIRLLRQLGHGDASSSEVMNDILAQVAINTESTKNPGNAILYECVQTIMSIEAEGGLRVLAVNILGRFLLNRDNNIRYVALNTLCKVVQSDSKAIQRHRNLVVDCLKDSDISIRKRALDLIYALVTKTNVKALVKELVNYLQLASEDLEFKSELTDKICTVVDRFAPSKHWHIDTIVQVLATAGRFTREEVSSNLIRLIVNSNTLHAFAVHKLYKTLVDTKTCELPLIHVGVYCIGEYGEHLVSDAGVLSANEHETGFVKTTEDDIITILEKYLRYPEATDVTKGYVLNALVKLSSRFSSVSEKMIALISQFDRSMSLELQQRSIEYSKLVTDMDLKKIRDNVVVRMPPIEHKKKADDDDNEFTESEDEPSEDEDDDDDESESDSDGGGGAKANTGGSATFDILGGLDLLTNDSAVAHALDTSQQQQQPQQQSNGDLDILSGLFGDSVPSAGNNNNDGAITTTSNDPLSMLMGATSTTTTVPVTAPIVSSPQPTTTAPGTFPPLQIFDKNGLVIMFKFKKPPRGDQSKTQIMASFTNNTGYDMQSFDFKVAVPKYLKLQMKPASASVIPANTSNSVTQLMLIENSAHGQRNLAVRFKILYMHNGQQVNEQAQASNFPAGL